MVLAHAGAGGEAQLAALLAAWLLWFGGLRLSESLQARACAGRCRVRVGLTTAGQRAHADGRPVVPAVLHRTSRAPRRARRRARR
jgi:hypothetical protein